MTNANVRNVIVSDKTAFISSLGNADVEYGVSQMLQTVVLNKDIWAEAITRSSSNC